MRRLNLYYIAFRATAESGIAQIRESSFGRARMALHREVKGIVEYWQVNAGVFQIATEKQLPECGWKLKNRIR